MKGACGLAVERGISTRKVGGLMLLLSKSLIQWFGLSSLKVKMY